MTAAVAEEMVQGLSLSYSVKGHPNDDDDPDQEEGTVQMCLPYWCTKKKGKKSERKRESFLPTNTILSFVLSFSTRNKKVGIVAQILSLPACPTDHGYSRAVT